MTEDELMRRIEAIYPPDYAFLWAFLPLVALWAFILTLIVWVRFR